MKNITIAGREIGPGKPCFIIAEAGVNHNGDWGMALKLVDMAAEAGADAVKFQTFKAEHLITPKAPKAKYHIETTGGDAEQTWFQLLKTQEISPAMHEAIIKRCKEKNIIFMSTPYEEVSADLLDKLDVPAFKIASTDANNIPFLKSLARKKRPIILSTAMCDLEEVKASVAAIREEGLEDLAVLQCTGSYPAQADQANLRAMLTLAKECNVITGYSDHVPGFSAALASIAMGACIYEKHFTLSKHLPGPDHRASIEPEELKALVLAIREVEAALGDGIKRIMPCEVDNKPKLQKKLIALKDMQKGDSFNEENLGIKRAVGIGLAPGNYGRILGRKLAVAVEEGQAVEENMLL